MLERGKTGEVEEVGGREYRRLKSECARQADEMEVD